MKPLAIDLFCGAGGAALGLYRAGFDVIGIDLAPQPRYPFQFVQGDALRPPFDLRRADLIWASPKCQAHTSLRMMHNAKAHVDQIAATRALLQDSGVPYVIENVPGAPLKPTCMLCGTHFGLGVRGAQLRRHRVFETNFPVEQPECRHGKNADVIGIYGGHARNRRRRPLSDNRGVADFSLNEAHSAMGIFHMTLNELSQAIPPAYSEFLARAALAAGAVNQAEAVE